MDAQSAEGDAVQAKPWGDPRSARVLVIGHDPRLQGSETVAEYSFFADHFFCDEQQKGGAVKAKYGLAKKVFDIVEDLTGGCVSPREVLVTNLCNEALPHAPKGKTVLIPEDRARRGIEAIRELLKGSRVRVIFPMSQQVNYWLQALEFYPADPKYLKDARPRDKGCQSVPPYYEYAGSAFPRICGREFATEDGRYVYPILHAKQYPLTDKSARSYAESYGQYRKMIRRRLTESRDEQLSVSGSTSQPTPSDGDRPMAPLQPPSSVHDIGDFGHHPPEGSVQAENRERFAMLYEPLERELAEREWDIAAGSTVERYLEAPDGGLISRLWLSPTKGTFRIRVDSESLANLNDAERRLQGLTHPAVGALRFQERKVKRTEGLPVCLESSQKLEHFFEGCTTAAEMSERIRSTTMLVVDTVDGCAGA